MKIYQSVVLTVTILGLLFFIGCSESPSAQAPSAEATKTAQTAPAPTPAAAETPAEEYPEFYEVRIPDIYDPNTVFLPYIAAKKGFYEAEGIKPVFTGVIGASQLVAAVVSKDCDIGYLHVNRTINGVAAGAPIKAVVADTETSEDFPHMEYLVLDESPLKEPLDMVGKKVGIITLGGCNEYTPYGILTKRGIEDPRDSFEIIVIPAGNEEVILRSGEVDVVGFHGHPLGVFNNGGVRIFFDDYQVWGKDGGATPWYFHEDFIKEKPEAVRRFVAAHIKTGKWINENREEARKIQSEWADVPVEKVGIMKFTDDGIITKKSVQIWIDTLKSYGELTVDLLATDIYTNEFNPNSRDYRFVKAANGSARQ
ncbi:MAG: ABC transporter substrate-binding protein [Deltaproteobacteria bacterium]|jgi:ABC-type nitrate/sulfonate/bicarbonate transport system substrate-binding protein|nr:ABC transporter substrate-binding protein [Deltaproteobacteria bacterium]